MNDFYGKSDYTINDILLLIENEVEESIYLDFKEANALDKSEGKKKDMSKDVSAFANSEGGIIIYGIKEANHRAHSLSYIDGNVFTKEWLEQSINSTIQRRISDLIIYPIRNNNDIDQTIYVVKIPKSLDAPHLCKDKRYYKRFNFESVPMEEYEIRQLYGRKLNSKLVLDTWNISRADKANEESSKMSFIIEISIFNDGDVMEKDYKVNLYFTNFNSHLKVHWQPQINNYDYTWFGKGRTKVSSSTTPIPIYPSETVTVLRLNFDVDKEFLSEALKDLEYQVRLFYTNGEDKMEGNFKELLYHLLDKSQRDST